MYKRTRGNTVFKTIYTRSDVYKYSYFPRTIITWSYILQVQHHRPVAYRVGDAYPPCAVRDVNTLLNFNCKYDWILAVQFGHAWSINTQPRVNSRGEEEEE